MYKTWITNPVQLCTISNCTAKFTKFKLSFLMKIGCGNVFSVPVWMGTKFFLNFVKMILALNTTS